MQTLALQSSQISAPIMRRKITACLKIAAIREFRPRTGVAVSSELAVAVAEL